MISRLFSVTLVLGIALGATIIACSDSKKPNVSPDAKVFLDAKVFMDAPAVAANALGQLCPFAAGGGGSACPTGNDCVTLMGLGSTTTGYCTPMCMGNNATCTTGYTGPAGGMPVCALSTGSGSNANGCAIICTTPAQCPTGMACTMVPMQTVKICVPS
ncbi:MAG: hypothetical protein JWO36_4214 [Myxococcales bacterium]|nr:hypothetical protein [Myxococcales bacterium]